MAGLRGPAGLTSQKSGLGAVRGVDLIDINSRARPISYGLIMSLEPMSAPDPSSKIQAAKASCQTCRLRDLCLPIGLPPEEIAKLDSLINRRQRVRAGQHIFRAQKPLHFLYAVRSGFFKAYEISNDGIEQVNGFYLGGEILGLDAISSGAHPCSAVALDDGEVCEIPFDALETLVRDIPMLQRQFHRIMSREIADDHSIMRLLSSMGAEQKLAVFLTSLSARFHLLGYSPTSLFLKMSREEIGNYLGLTLETVSRTFRKLQDDGLLEVQRRHIEIRNLGALQHLTGVSRCNH